MFLFVQYICKPFVLCKLNFHTCSEGHLNEKPVCEYMILAHFFWEWVSGLWVWLRYSVLKTTKIKLTMADYHSGYYSKTDKPTTLRLYRAASVFVQGLSELSWNSKSWPNPPPPPPPKKNNDMQSPHFALLNNTLLVPQRIQNETYISSVNRWYIWLQHASTVTSQQDNPQFLAETRGLVELFPCIGVGFLCVLWFAPTKYM